MMTVNIRDVWRREGNPILSLLPSRWGLSLLPLFYTTALHRASLRCQFVHHGLCPLSQIQLTAFAVDVAFYIYSASFQNHSETYLLSI